MVNGKWAALACAAALGACASGGGGPSLNRDTPAPLALLSADALMYARFDADDDLLVSQSEIETGISREFARADQNHDGALSPLEFSGWSQAALGGNQLPPYRLDFDRNVDNSITAEEFANEIRARARDYDRDEDGVLRRAEFLRPTPRARARIGAPEGGAGAQERPPRERPR